jgi:hypothetical protein
LVTHILSRLFRAVGSDLVQPVDGLGIAATVIDQTLDAIATTATARATSNVKRIELAD